MLTSENFQRYARIVLYALFSAMTTIGVTLPDNTKTMIAGVVGFLANLAWTVWGNTLSAKLAEVSKAADVDSGKLAAAVADPDLKAVVKEAAK